MSVLELPDREPFERSPDRSPTLGARHPLAATLLLRAMIDFSLKEGRVKRYRHVARHLAECASLAAAIVDFRGFETHEAYVARLRDEHGRKSSFWSLVP
jgi:hypothetical protein